MEKFIKKFERNFYGNSLIIQSLTNDAAKRNMVYRRILDDDISRTMTDGLHMISHLYLYTNAPPHGYGTPAPKVAETVLRSYSYNKIEHPGTTTVHGKTINKFAITDLQMYPFDQVTGNFNPRSARLMSRRFLRDNSEAIIGTARETIEQMKKTNPDVLTRGRQTWDPASLKSVTSAKAYSRFMEILSDNEIPIPTNCLEFLKTFSDLFEREKLEITKREVIATTRLVYSRVLKGWKQVERKRIVMRKTTVNGKDNVTNWLVDYTRSFCSYIKHGERGKKDRRAIASANIPLRMLLYIIEAFHLELGKIIPGSTISIGGEEKKMKINRELFATSSKMVSGEPSFLQATEDATKWNECMNPMLFGLIHHEFFSEENREDLGLPPPNDEEKLFMKICLLTFSIMSVKRINLGPGVIISNDSEYQRVDWCNVPRGCLNKKTAKWHEEIKPYLEEDNYVLSSPGFLMGMLNAASTTVGLIAVGYKQMREVEVTTLRSSDDSMTVFAAPSIKELAKSIEINRKSLKLIGINPSTSKSLFFEKGYGEYTSWYQDGDFIAQCGVETSSLKPGGSNAQDDFNTIASNTTTLLRTNTINKIGAISRIMVGIDNVRRLWKVGRNSGKRPELTRSVVFLADGGDCPWNLENLAMEESVLRYSNIKTDLDRKYFMKVMDPQNPFSDTPDEQIAWSKQAGTLVMNTIDTARNVFCYVKRSNKTINNETSKLEAMKEKHHKEAYEIMTSSEPSFHLKIPPSKSSIADYIKTGIMLKVEKLNLSPEEKLKVETAIRILEGTQHSEDLEDDFEDNFQEEIVIE